MYHLLFCRAHFAPKKFEQNGWQWYAKGAGFYARQEEKGREGVDCSALELHAETAIPIALFLLNLFNILKNQTKRRSKHLVSYPLLSSPPPLPTPGSPQERTHGKEIG